MDGLGAWGSRLRVYNIVLSCMGATLLFRAWGFIAREGGLSESLFKGLQSHNLALSYKVSSKQVKKLRPKEKCVQPRYTRASEMEKHSMHLIREYFELKPETLNPRPKQTLNTKLSIGDLGTNV